jgi:rod shape-determining protein MreD
MLNRRAFLTGFIFLGVFALQLVTVDQVHLPLGGFSLFLIFALCWSALSAPEMGAVSGFFAGFLLDLSPTASGPIGEWTLILVAIGYGIAFLRYGDDSLRTNPLSLVITVAGAVMLSLSAYLLLNLLMGSDLGNAWQATKTILGNGLWTLAIAPFVLPIASRLHIFVFESRELA